MRRPKNGVINRHDLEAAARNLASSFSIRNAVAGRRAGMSVLQASLREFFRAFPDVKESVEDVVCSTDREYRALANPYVGRVRLVSPLRSPKRGS